VSTSLDEALALKRTGDLQGALLALEGFLSTKPDHPIATAHLADVQIRRKRFDEAEGALDRAERVAGTSSFTAKLRGDLYYKQSRWQEAARAYQDADALGETGTWALVQLARCRLRLNDIEGARGAASRAAERDESSASVWVLLGDISLKEKQLDDAEAMYARAHDVAPNDEWAYSKLVDIRLLRLPEGKRAREAEILWKSSGRSNKHLMGVLAKYRSEQGDEDKAAETWGQRADQHNDPYARRMYGFALRKAGRLDEAAAVLGRCLVEEPHNIPVFRTYIQLQRKRGALDELRRTLEEALPGAGSRRGAFYGELKKLPAPTSDPTDP
jgi:tetratricopeptide (TPR) repeat protein